MRRHLTAAALAALTLSLAGCGGGEGEEDGDINMTPGQDCLSCHTGDPRRFTAAGTVFRSNGTGAAGVTVTVTIGGSVKTTTTSTAGNFAFDDAGAVSATTVAGTAMPGGNGINGRCNSCHSGNSRLIAP